MEIRKIAAKCSGALFFTIFALPFNTASAQVEEIVVTARKRDETQLEIPVAVSVLSQDGLDDRGVTTTEGLSNYTPGFDFQNLGQGGTSGRENPSIRFRGVAVQQSSPASRAGAIFWNGAYISDGAGILPLVDLERAEVLKGPQSAVFGRNTFAGAVNFISKEPTDEITGRGSIEITPSEDNGYALVGAIGGPIGERFGVRIAATTQNKGADYEYRDGTPLGEEETVAGQIALTFDATDNLRIKYSGFLVDSEDTRALSSQIGPVAPGNCNRTFSGRLRNVGSGQIVGTFTTDLSQSARSLFCGTIPDWDDVPPNVPFVGIPTSASSSVPFGGGLDFVKRVPVELEGKDMVNPPDGLGNTYSLWRNHLSAEYDFGNGYGLSGFVSTGESQHWGINDANYGTPIFVRRPMVFRIHQKHRRHFDGGASHLAERQRRLRYSVRAQQLLPGEHQRELQPIRRFRSRSYSSEGSHGPISTPRKAIISGSSVRWTMTSAMPSHYPWKGAGTGMSKRLPTRVDPAASSCRQTSRSREKNKSTAPSCRA